MKIRQDCGRMYVLDTVGQKPTSVKLPIPVNPTKKLGKFQLNNKSFEVRTKGNQSYDLILTYLFGAHTINNRGTP